MGYFPRIIAASDRPTWLLVNESCRQNVRPWKHWFTRGLFSDAALRLGKSGRTTRDLGSRSSNDDSRNLISGNFSSKLRQVLEVPLLSRRSVGKLGKFDNRIDLCRFSFESRKKTNTDLAGWLISPERERSAYFMQAFNSPHSLANLISGFHYARRFVCWALVLMGTRPPAGDSSLLFLFFCSSHSITNDTVFYIYLVEKYGWKIIL